MRRTLTLLATLVALTLGGCSGTTVEPGDGPAAEPSAVESTEPEVVEGDPPADLPSEEPTEDAAPAPANFSEKYVYADGLEVEVTKIRTLKLSEYPTTSDNSGKQGDPYIAFSVRVKNGSKASVTLLGSATVTYGPDGEEAASVYESTLSSMDGKLIPGKAKTGSYGFIIPAKHRNDVVMEFSTDFDHESAVFSGSIK